MSEQEPQATKRETHSSRAGKRRAIVFAVVFLTCTLLSLVGYHYAADSSAMQWYLFHVAKHTTYLLKLGAAECQLETPEQFTGREATIRAAIKAWSSGTQPDTSVSTQAIPGPPLTAWEAFRYRTLLRKEMVAEYERRFRALDEAPSVVFKSEEEANAYTAQRIEHLELSVGKNGQVVPVRPDLSAAILEIKQQYNALQTPDGIAGKNKTLELQAILKNLDELRIDQVRVVQDSLRRLQSSPEGDGPLVLLTLSISPDTEIERSNRQLQMLASEPGLTEEGRQARRDAITQRLMKAQAAKAALGDKPAEKNRMFHFRVVPDCGALPSMTIFVASVLAFPASWRKRLIGVAAGLPLLYIINLIRLAALAVLGAVDTSGRWFNFAHHYVWQGIYLVFVVAVWLAWVEFIVYRRPTCKNPAE